MSATLRDDVAALYVDRLGPYPNLVREWYDETRDARTYTGPWPVVAHPPCGPWGSLRKHWSRGQADLGLLAFQQVRRFGGVLEQPAYSRLFEACRAPRPGEFADEHGGISIEVRQVDMFARANAYLPQRGRRGPPKYAPLVYDLDYLMVHPGCELAAPCHEAHVYFVRPVGGGLIKIGRAWNPSRRVGELQTGSPVELELMVVAAGNAQTENDLHNRFRHLRAHREWYRPDPELLDYVSVLLHRLRTWPKVKA